MIENDTQNSRQAASTAFHNAPKLAKIAQAGVHGGLPGLLPKLRCSIARKYWSLLL